jgi:hypothetical protein
MEQKHGTSWRKEAKEKRFYLRRLPIYKAIERMGKVEPDMNSILEFMETIRGRTSIQAFGDWLNKVRFYLSL